MVEARKRQVRPCRHEEGVEELRIAIEGAVARDKVNRKLVLTGSGRVRRNHQVAVSHLEGDVRGARTDVQHVFPGFREVQHDPAVVAAYLGAPAA